MDINIRAFGGESTCFCYNFDPNPMNFLPNPAAPARSTLLGGHATPVDPDLKGQYSDEWIIGGEYEVARNVSVGAKYVRRNLGRVIEDFLVPDESQYFIANPGVGLGSEMSFYDYTAVGAPKVKRVSDSFELSGRKRYSDGWQFLASYVWQKLEGNYDGVFQNSTGQLDPNINSAFDYADFLVNADGRLTNDRTHQIKFDGSYEFQSGPTGLNLGFSTYWLSGMPLNAYGYSFAVCELGVLPGASRITRPRTVRMGSQPPGAVSNPVRRQQADQPDHGYLQPVRSPEHRFSSTSATTCAARPLLVGSGGRLQRRQWLVDAAGHAESGRFAEQSAGERAEPGLPDQGNPVHAAAEHPLRRPLPMVRRGVLKPGPASYLAGPFFCPRNLGRSLLCSTTIIASIACSR